MGKICQLVFSLFYFAYSSEEDQIFESIDEIHKFLEGLAKPDEKLTKHPYFSPKSLLEKELLDNFNLLILGNVEGDGACFFRSIHAIFDTFPEKHLQNLQTRKAIFEYFTNSTVSDAVFGQINSKKLASALDSSILRKITVNELKRNKDNYIYFVTNDDRLGSDNFEANFDKYVNKMAKKHFWADYVACNALANALNIKIKAYEVTSTSIQNLHPMECGSENTESVFSVANENQNTHFYPLYKASEGAISSEKLQVLEDDNKVSVFSFNDDENVGGWLNIAPFGGEF